MLYCYATLKQSALRRLQGGRYEKRTNLTDAKRGSVAGYPQYELLNSSKMDLLESLPQGTIGDRGGSRNAALSKMRNGLAVDENQVRNPCIGEILQLDVRPAPCYALYNNLDMYHGVGNGNAT